MNTWRAAMLPRCLRRLLQRVAVMPLLMASDIADDVDIYATLTPLCAMRARKHHICSRLPARRHVTAFAPRYRRRLPAGVMTYDDSMMLLTPAAYCSMPRLLPCCQRHATVTPDAA